MVKQFFAVTFSPLSFDYSNAACNMPEDGSTDANFDSG